jgi:hypothetical protein
VSVARQGRLDLNSKDGVVAVPVPATPIVRLNALTIEVAGRKRVHARLRRAMPGDDARVV